MGTMLSWHCMQWWFSLCLQARHLSGGLPWQLGNISKPLMSRQNIIRLDWCCFLCWNFCWIFCPTKSLWRLWTQASEFDRACYILWCGCILIFREKPVSVVLHHFHGWNLRDWALLCSIRLCNRIHANEELEQHWFVDFQCFWSCNVLHCYLVLVHYHKLQG